MLYYTDGEEHYEFICDCGHEFDTDISNDHARPDKCSKCGRKDFKTYADYAGIQLVSPNIGL